MLRTIGGSSAVLRRGVSSTAAQCGGSSAASPISPLLIPHSSSPAHSPVALALAALSRTLVSLHPPPPAPQTPLSQSPQNPCPALIPPSQQQQPQQCPRQQHHRSLHSPASPPSAFRLPLAPLLSASRAPFSSAADSAPTDSSSPDPPPPASDSPSAPNPAEIQPAPSERVGRLVDEILGLSLLEMSEMTAAIRKRLGMPANAGMGGMPMGMMMMPGGSGGGGGEAAAAAAEEKTAFDVKLEGFEAAAKLKVIKEVRGIAGLGLKEAKEFVEKAPVVVKAGVSKEEAAAIVEKLKAVGATVVVE
ncbi:hypothetical protein CLOM_g21775 [Closterium sp. NIES-68]|nr:hypothetical protein CLOM_g21775 [Closterium sp. NIES-68]GJP74080.1 hypothetical protein CLOP_g4719 [Closterium sp. NIES-67]